MVQQCNDCSLWFRTEDKFRNHKQGSLGLYCAGAEKSSGSDEKVTKSQEVNEETSISDDDALASENSMKPVEETKKIADYDISDDESSDVMTEQGKLFTSEDFSISDDEENDKSNNETSTLLVKEKVQSNMSPDDQSKIKKSLSLEEALETKVCNKESPRLSELMTPSSDSVSSPSTPTTSKISTESKLSSPKTPIMTLPLAKTSLERNPNYNTTPSKTLAVPTESKLSPQTLTRSHTPAKTSLGPKSSTREISPTTSVKTPTRFLSPSLSLSKPPTPTTSKLHQNPPKTQTKQLESLRKSSVVVTDTLTAKLNSPLTLNTSSPKHHEKQIRTGQISPGSKNVRETKRNSINSTQSLQNDRKGQPVKSNSQTVEKLITAKDKKITEKDDSIMLSDDDKSDDEGDYSKTSSKSDFTLICIHLDKFTVSNEASYTISQVGASTALSGGREATFFRPIKPPNLEHYLENYKMEGDLLKALHITESDKGKFEFRAQFEIKRKEKNKIYCSSEHEALKGIRDFIRKYENVILFAIDKETIDSFLTKIDFEEGNPVKGYMTWSSVLKHCTYYLGKKSYDSDLDLEDFYSEHCGKVAGYINTLDVSAFLEKSIKKLFNDYAKKLSLNSTDASFTWHDIFQNIVEKLDKTLKPKEQTTGAVASSQANISVEVYSSFRPSVSTKIGLEKMETLELSSGPDSDIDVLEERVTKKPKQNKDMLRQKLKKQFDLLKMRQRLQTIERSKRGMQRGSASVRQPPHKKRKTQITPAPPASTAIVISSGDEDEDTEEEWVDHRRVVTDLQQRNPNLNVIPVAVPMPPVTPLSEASVTNMMNWPNCTMCNLEFAGLDALKTHIDRIHLRCSLCNLQFSVLEVAMAHKKVHDENAVAFKPVQESQDITSILSPTVLLNENVRISTSTLIPSSENLLKETTDAPGLSLGLE